MNRGRVIFWSSTEGHGCQRALIEALRRFGWEAKEESLVTIQEYRAARSALQRAVVRIRAYCIYPLKVVMGFLQPDSSTLAVISSNTFFAPWIALVVARNRQPVIHWVLDLYPDVLAAAGVSKRQGLAFRISARIMKSTFRNSSANVFLGQRLLCYANGQFGTIPRARAIPIGADESTLRDGESLSSTCNDSGRTEIIYCGNMGHMHDLHTLVGALRHGVPDGLRLSFRGNGVGMATLQAQLKSIGMSASVSFGPSLEGGEWARELRRCQVALVTLRAGAEFLVMPSKTFSALLAGQAVLAVCTRESDLGDLITDNELGWVVEPGDIIGLQRVLQLIATHHAEVSAKRQNAFNVGWSLFQQQVLGRQWDELLRAVVAEWNGPPVV